MDGDRREANMTAVRRVLVAIAACTATLALASVADADVVTFPSSQTIPAEGRLPAGGAARVTLNTAIGEREGAWLVVTGGLDVSASIDATALAPLKATISFAHFVDMSGRPVPDALMPWDGRIKQVERPNQPLYLQVVVPPEAKPGTYRASVRVMVDGTTTDVPVAIRVFNVHLPTPGTAAGALLTAFHVVPESYVAKVDEIYHLGTNPARSAANVALFSFLFSYRISPAGWGYGEPRGPTGYTASPKWWLDAANNMVKEAQFPFTTMRIPISNQRASTRNRVAGVSPFEPDGWCTYLQSVHDFWGQHGWLDGRLPYLYTLDEPGPGGMKLVAQQAAVGHQCFPGARMLVTGNPSQTNRFLWDDRGDDDADIWAVLSRRYYGQSFRPREKLDLLTKARSAGKQIWSTTYTGVPGTPGYSGAEPLSDPRMFLLWNALEGITGTLYAQGTTSYGRGDPLASVADNGEYVLIYPGAQGPIPSARLEQIRDGIEDWSLFDIVRRQRGLSTVRSLLGRAGLFSATSRGVMLACKQGCEHAGATEFSWPEWSHDATTDRRIEQARLQALKLVS